MPSDDQDYAATIYLIRHGEKPGSETTEDGGIDDNGKADPESLTPRGWRRAGAWAVFFGPLGRLPSPQRIYASNDQKDKLGHGDKVGSHSQRPIETVTELAQRLFGAGPDTSFTKGQEPQLVHDIAALSGITLVCWQHEAIPQIASLFSPQESVPSPWPVDRFDAVWRLRRADSASEWVFDQICPQLLSGDLATPIA